MNSKKYTKQGLKFKLGCKVDKVNNKDNLVSIEYTDVKNLKKKL